MNWREVKSREDVLPRKKKQESKAKTRARATQRCPCESRQLLGPRQTGPECFPRGGPRPGAGARVEAF